jgi:hypothetical protein
MLESRSSSSVSSINLGEFFSFLPFRKEVFMLRDGSIRPSTPLSSCYNTDLNPKFIEFPKLFLVFRLMLKPGFFSYFAFSIVLKLLFENSLYLARLL